MGEEGTEEKEVFWVFFLRAWVPITNATGWLA